MSEPQHLEALVVGAGFGGLYSLYLLKQQGLNVKAIEKGSDVGGTWFWNRYPGARSDVESLTYRYSWDKELLQTYPWPHNYLQQPELQAYFQDVAKKHDLYKLIQFDTVLEAATWDDNPHLWTAQTSTGDTFVTRYLIDGLGILHKLYISDIPGLGIFEGRVVHSSNWSPDIDYKGKRIAVIGDGASGVHLRYPVHYRFPKSPLPCLR